MDKVVFLIDGLNFYYSILYVKRDTGVNAKWFDYFSLCEFYKNDLSKRRNKQMEIGGIFYFTSIIVRTFNMSNEEYLKHKNNQMVYLKTIRWST